MESWCLPTGTVGSLTASGSLSGLLCAPLQADRQYDMPPPHRLPKQPKDGFLVEQVFSPHPYPASLKAHMKNNPLYTDMRLTELAEVKRGQPSWTIEEYSRNAGEKGKLTALDLQVSLSLPRGGGSPATPWRKQEWIADALTGPLPHLQLPGSPPWNSEPAYIVEQRFFTRGLLFCLLLCKHVAVGMLDRLID